MQYQGHFGAHWWQHSDSGTGLWSPEAAPSTRQARPQLLRGPLGAEPGAVRWQQRRGQPPLRLTMLPANGPGSVCFFTEKNGEEKQKKKGARRHGAGGTRPPLPPLLRSPDPAGAQGSAVPAGAAFCRAHIATRQADNCQRVPPAVSRLPPLPRLRKGPARPRTWGGPGPPPPFPPLTRGPAAGEGRSGPAAQGPHLAVRDDEALVALPVVLPFILVHLLHFHARPGPPRRAPRGRCLPPARRPHAATMAAARRPPRGKGRPAPPRPAPPPSSGRPPQRARARPQPPLSPQCCPLPGEARAPAPGFPPPSGTSQA